MIEINLGSRQLLKSLSGKDKGNSIMYKNYRNKVNRVNSKLRRNFFENKVDLLKQSNPKDWWKNMKSLMGVRWKHARISHCDQ